MALDQSYPRGLPFPVLRDLNRGISFTCIGMLLCGPINDRSGDHGAGSIV